MPNVTQREAIKFIRRLEDFTASNFYGERIGPTYYVFSYDKLIARHDGKMWAVNPNRYSVTTSRHQRLVRHAIGDAPINAKWYITDMID